MVTTGCNRSFMNDEPEEPGTTAPAAPVYMSASIAVRATQADLASNSQNAEDEIAQLRILAFNSATGKLAINKFYGSAEQDQFSNQPAGTTAAWKGAFQIVPDKYDFFFIANENSWPEVKAALQAMSVGVSTVSDLYTKDFAMRIPYGVSDAAKNKENRTFYPSVPGTPGTPGHLILATRTYRNVTVLPIRNGKGGSATDPQHFEAEGDEKVELIRTLAKVKVRIPHSATVVPDGAGYKIKQFLPSRIQRIVLKDEVPYQSLFLNPFLDSNHYTSGKKFMSDWYTNASTDAKRDYVLYDRALLTNNNETGLSVGVGAEAIVPAGATYDANRRYDCVIWFYVPEHLRQLTVAEPTAPGMVNGATGLLFEKVGTSAGNTFGIWQNDFTEGQQKVFDNGGSSKFYSLPNANLYSKFSVVRNNVYDITVRYAGAQLMLQYKMLPWVKGGTSGVYAMDAFNVYTADPEFKNTLTNIILSTTTQRLAAGDYIELKAKNGFKFVANGTESNTIKYGDDPTERVFRHYRTIQLKAANAPVATGTAVFEVWNQGKLLYTVNASAQ